MSTASSSTTSNRSSPSQREQNSYKAICSHFESNKRTKEYVAHQSKASLWRVVLLHVGVSRDLVLLFRSILLVGAVMVLDWPVVRLTRLLLFGVWSRID